MRELVLPVQELVDLLVHGVRLTLPSLWSPLLHPGPTSSWRAQFVDGHVFAALRCLPQWYGPGVPPLPEDERAAALELADAYRALLEAAPTTLQHDKDLLGERGRSGALRADGMES